MDIYGTWFSELGFEIEIQNDSLLISGQFNLNSQTHSFRGIYIENSENHDLSFIIAWESNMKTSTTFTGKLLKENSLSLNWLLFIEDEETAKMNTFQGNLVLKRYPSKPILSASSQDKLPYPKILSEELFLI